MQKGLPQHRWRRKHRIRRQSSVPSFSAEQLEAMGLPEDLSEESIASMQYIYGNQEIGMMISVPIYWMQVKPENGAPNQCYFYLRADEENITSFSISSQDYVLENGTEEAVIKEQY